LGSPISLGWFIAVISYQLSVISYQLSVITSLITLYCLLKKLATRQFPTTDRYVNISKVLPIKASYGLSHKDEV
jgi:hypothetical protein